MAKTPIGLGQFSGKVGGVIFAVYNGEQIVRQYQPKVNNPKSSAQQLQRAKGNLVGRISQIVPWQILQGMGQNRRERRANFLRVALNLASASPVADNLRNISATLASENFIFSRGAVLPAVSISNPVAASTSVGLTLSRANGVSDEIFNASGTLVVAVIKSVNGRYENIVYEFVSPEDFVDNVANITLNHISEGNYSCSIYIAPFSTLDGASLRTKTQQLTGDGTGLHAILNNNPAAIPLSWGDSLLVANVNFPNTSKQNEEEGYTEEETKIVSKTKKK